MIHIYRHLLDSANEETTVKNLAQRLLIKTVGMIDVPASAADYINTGGHLYRSTRNFRMIGLSGYRMLASDQSEGTLTKQSVLDQFLSEERRREHPNMCLWDWAKQCNCKGGICQVDHVPIFTGINVKPYWPVTEDYAQAMLMIFKEGTWTTLDDLRADYETYAEALAEFVESPSCPDILTDLLKEAKKKFDKKKAKTRRNRQPGLDSNANSQSTYGGSQSSQPTSQDSIAQEMNLARDIMRDIGERYEQELDDPYAEVILPNGGPDFDWNAYAMETFGGQWPDDTATWLETITEEEDANDEARGNECELPNINLLCANELQATVIAINLQRLLQIAKDTLPPDTEPIHLLIQGTAGVGKTFVINALTRVARRLFNRNHAVMNLAPTGAASVLLPDGRTVHSVAPPPRKMRKDKDAVTAQLADYPLNQDKLRTLRRHTGVHEDNQLKLFLLNMDERSMYAKSLLAWASHRFSEATGCFDHYFGGIPLVNSLGDLGQMGPFMANDTSEAPVKNDTPPNLAGYAIYKSFVDVIVLLQTMRQGPDQIHFLERLLRLRNGTVTQADWQAFNSRFEGNLSPQELANFQHDRVITLMETWAEVNEENHNKLANLGVPVAVIPSKGRGRHHSLTDKQVGQIPLRSLLAVGATVMLTKNQVGLTGLGLNNGAMGKVVAILYEKDCNPPSFPTAVVVNFPNYKGPAWLQNHPTWIPIIANESRCESDCCTRNGLPLIPGYAITITKSQGMSIGDNKDITHVRIKLQDSIDMEAHCLGLAYTAFSRVEKERNYSLVQPIPEQRLMYVNTHKRMKSRQEEEKRLRELSQKTIEKYNITTEKYIELLQELDEYCNDGITDSQCLHPSENCKCILCHRHYR